MNNINSRKIIPTSKKKGDIEQEKHGLNFHFQENAVDGLFLPTEHNKSPWRICVKQSPGVAVHWREGRPRGHLWAQKVT